MNTTSGAIDAHWGAGQVYDFYKSLGRDGLDGKGGSMTSVVDVVYGGKAYDNAFWDGTKMVYGRASNGRSFASDLDVVGHEMTHGVTQHTAGLLYVNQSGAINEAMSDYLGNAIDVTASGTAMSDPDAGLLGEDLCPDKVPRDCALRDMNDGRRADRDFVSAPIDVDSGGVHLNSTIFSGALWDVREHIDPALADRIAYTALTQYFTPFTDFYSGRLAVLDAARALGADGKQLRAVRKAFDAHGIVKGWEKRQPHDADVLLDDILPASAPDVSGNHWVASTENWYSGAPEIHVGYVNDKGGDRSRVISEPATGSATENGVIGNTAPRISGGTVVWTRLTRVNPYWVNADVVKAKFDGTGPVTDLEPGGGMQGSPDIDGDTIVWTGDVPDGGTYDHSDLFMKKGDQDWVNLTPDSKVEAHAPRVSDGLIAFVHADRNNGYRLDVGAYRPATGELTVLKAGTGPDGDAQYPTAVDTNGHDVVWAESLYDYPTQLHAASADGSHDRVLVPAGTARTPYSPSITVNADYLVYSDYRGYYTDDYTQERAFPNLWMMPLSGSPATPVSCDAGGQEAPVLGTGRRVLWIDSTFGNTGLVTREARRTHC
ncbi:M4 family metallopeptidase [Streptomyces sp. NBC_01465]|uniref:M4 family metallopeptidase n=1 Tax=Streptomyces sp. NBC_01465 TaxID=2903878 RepID=UPI002E2FD083|nr:M4 family metallopeptidase [Streptomyces sp. NBC_01465]